MLSHHQANAWCCPQGPGPTFGNHGCLFSHGPLPVLGPCCHPNGAQGTLPPPGLEKPVLHCSQHPPSPSRLLQPTGRPATEVIMFKCMLDH